MPYEPDTDNRYLSDLFDKMSAIKPSPSFFRDWPETMRAMPSQLPHHEGRGLRGINPSRPRLTRGLSRDSSSYSGHGTYGYSARP